ncbi:MAG: lipopolysaccharide biosynthesis protein [Pseudoalteromonas sp.]|uniref:lipopolysaccharide biosynthesis protein n=1 Tax=Pseudoalteromonas sp. TaxID=53249 RepID=UPI003F9C619F
MNKLKGPLALAFTESLTKLIGLLLLPIITASLSLDEFGVYALFLINYIFFMALYVAILNNFILVGYFSRKRRVLFDAKAAILFNSLFFVALSIVFFLVALYFDIWDYFFIFFISSLACIVAQPSQVYLTFKQCRQEYIKYAKFSLVFVCSYALLAIVAYNIGLSTWQEFASLILISHLIQSFLLFFIEIGNIQHALCSKRSSIKRYSRHFKSLLGNSIFGWARVNIDKYLVITVLGSVAMATYSLGFQLGAVIGLLNTILIKLLNPILFASFQNKQSYKARKLTIAVLVAFAIISTCYVLLLPFIVGTFFNQEYQSSILVAQLVSGGYFIQVTVSIAGAVLFYEKRNYLISLLSMISFFTLILALLFLYALDSFTATYVAVCFVVSWCTHLILTLFFALKEPTFKGFIKNA